MNRNENLWWECLCAEFQGPALKAFERKLVSLTEGILRRKGLAGSEGLFPSLTSTKPTLAERIVEHHLSEFYIPPRGQEDVPASWGVDAALQRMLGNIINNLIRKENPRAHKLRKAVQELVLHAETNGVARISRVKQEGSAQAKIPGHTRIAFCDSQGRFPEVGLSPENLPPEPSEDLNIVAGNVSDREDRSKGYEDRQLTWLRSYAAPGRAPCSFREFFDLVLRLHPIAGTTYVADEDMEKLAQDRRRLPSGSGAQGDIEDLRVRVGRVGRIIDEDPRSGRALIAMHSHICQLVENLIPKQPDLPERIFSEIVQQIIKETGLAKSAVYNARERWISLFHRVGEERS